MSAISAEYQNDEEASLNDSVSGVGGQCGALRRVPPGGNQSILTAKRAVARIKAEDALPAIMTALNISGPTTEAASDRLRERARHYDVCDGPLLDLLTFPWVISGREVRD